MATSSEYNIYKNIVKYLTRLGYVIQHKSLEYENFIKTMQFVRYVVLKAKRGKENIHVFQIHKDMTKIVDTMFSKTVKGVPVTIVGHQFVNMTKSIISYGNKKIDVTYLNSNLFKIDIRNNIMVPKHTLCTEERAKQIMSEEFADDISQLPSIKYNDPQVILIGGKIGQIVEIIRKDVLTGETPYYRVIVA